MIDFINTEFGDIDILINNAGIAKIQMFTDITDNDWNQVLGTNLNSAFYCTQEVLPNMIHNKNGCIINISSVWGITGASCEVAYSVSKAGIDVIALPNCLTLSIFFLITSFEINGLTPSWISTIGLSFL